MAKLRFEVSKAIEGKFEVVNTSLPCLESKIGLVDFRKITLNQAERLFAKGTRYLKKVEAKPTEKATKKSK